jgi:hypothetical protein
MWGDENTSLSSFFLSFFLWQTNEEKVSLHFNIYRCKTNERTSKYLLLLQMIARSGSRVCQEIPHVETDRQPTNFKLQNMNFPSERLHFCMTFTLNIQEKSQNLIKIKSSRELQSEFISKLISVEQFNLQIVRNDATDRRIFNLTHALTTLNLSRHDALN